MTATFGDRVRGQLRAEVLDAAAGVIAAGGWSRLRMQAVAEEVGVSRRTLYNEFGGKPQLAEALVERSVARLGETVHRTFTTAHGLRAGWHDAVLAVLHDADRDPVLGAVLTETSSPDFLPLLTSTAGPAIGQATAGMAVAAGQRWSHLSEDRLALAAHATVRLVISHFLRPGPSYADAAREIAELVTGYLEPA